MRIFSFEKLIVWQKARQLSIKIYKSTKHFPSEEKFGITSKMRRASISISSNIAEGTGRRSAKDKARITEMAYVSALELNQCIPSNALEFLEEDKYLELRKELTKIKAMLDGLYNHKLYTNFSS